MSYILNALRKSETERQATKAESLEDRLLETTPTVEKKTPKTFIALIVFNICLVIYFFVSLNTQVKTQPPPTPVKTKQKTEAAVKKHTETAPQPIAHPKPQFLQQSIASQIKKQQKAVEKPVVNKPIIAKTIKKSQAKEQDVALPVPETQPLTEEVYIAPEIAQQDIPFLSELPSSFRRTVPDLKINVFVYSENPDERFIMTDMQKYQVGQQLESGIMIKEIREDSLVVEYKNLIFKLRR